MGGRILALNENFGYRPLLNVVGFRFFPQENARTPRTQLWGNQLMFQYDNPALWKQYLDTLCAVPNVYDQMRLAYEDSPEEVYKLWPRLPVVKVAEETLTLQAYGKDVLLNYWLEFSGPIQLFSQHDWWVEGQINY
jgi:hypothetical protein